MFKIILEERLKMRKKIIGFSMVMGTMLGMNSAFAGGYVGIGYDSYFTSPYVYGGINVYESKGMSGSIEAGFVGSEFSKDESDFVTSNMKFMYMHEMSSDKTGSVLLGVGINIFSGASTSYVEKTEDGTKTISSSSLSESSSLPTLLVGYRYTLMDNIDARITYELSGGNETFHMTPSTISVGIAYKF